MRKYPIDPGKLISTTLVYYESEMYNQTDWHGLPQEGVILVVVIREDGSRRTLPTKDYYFQAEGQNDLIIGSTDSPKELLRYSPLEVLYGGWTDDATFEAIKKLALTDE